jgi:hypothetical protein
MKTRIVLKSFQALSPAAMAAEGQAGQAGRGDPGPIPAPARSLPPSLTEASHVPVRFKYFVAPAQDTRWQETVASALNDIEV